MHDTLCVLVSFCGFPSFHLRASVACAARTRSALLTRVVFCSSPAGAGATNSLWKNAPAWIATEAYKSPLLAKQRRTAHGVPRTLAVSPFGTEEH